MARHVRHTKTLHEVKSERHNRVRKARTVGIFLIIVIISVLAGTFAFRYMTDSHIANGSSNAKDAITKSDANSNVTYTLLKLDTDAFSYVPDIYKNLNNTRTYCLLRVDTSSNMLSLCTLPANVACTLNGSDERPLYAFESEGGDSTLISAINELLGIQVNHFVSLDGDSIEKFVDGLGGIDITLSAQIDDPYAGNTVIDAGGAKRAGSEILQILRARQMSDFYTTYPNIVNDCMINVLNKVITLSETDFSALLSDVSRGLFSDMSSGDFGDAIKKIKNVNFSDASRLVLTGSQQVTNETNELVFSIRVSEFNQMVPKFRDGADPSTSEMIALTKNPSSVSVEVRNGAGIAGAASKMSEIIKAKGYDVEKSGNAEEGYVYTETLIVYMDKDYESCAYDIMNTLGCGRVIFGGDYYSSEQNIISIVGSDWAPTS